MGTLKHHGGRLLAKNGHLCLSCCDSCASPWSWDFTVTPRIYGPEWSQVDQQTVRLSYKDSSDCSSSGVDWIQAGTAACCAIAPESGALIISASGLVETQNAGYEMLHVRIDGGNVLTSGSTESGGGCVMEEKSESTVIPVVQGQIVRIMIDSTTKDGRYHLGAYWQIGFSFGPTPPASSRIASAAMPASPGALRFAICKSCSESLQDGFACRLVGGCCFGRKRSETSFSCPQGKW
jgi:hypothetical protein